MSAADVLTLRAERPANGGSAIAHAPDGRVVFVQGAIPGETVTARTVSEKQGFLSARVVDVLERSPHRVEARCAAAAHGAGCCDLSFVEAAHARNLKSEVLRDVLTRIGGFGAEVLDGLDGPPVAALDDADTGWRIRTRLAVDADGRAGLHEQGGPRIVVGAHCAQPDPAMTVGVDAGYSPHTELAIVLDASGRRHITEIAPPAHSSAAGTRRGQRSGSGAGADRSSAQRRRRGREAGRSIRVLEGEASAVHRVGGRSWRIPITGFWQGHRAAPAEYAQTVGDFVARHTTGVRTCWDLYGGAGVFAATLVDEVGAGRVDIVDSDAGALKAAGDTFADDPGVHCHRGEVARAIAELPAPDVVIVDPPRTGLGSRVIGQIVDADPEVVVHVGCDVGRFARDLSMLCARGYRLRAVRGFDAFPLTHHLEAIAVLVGPRSDR